MASYAATGIVLHRTNLGENDKILTLYTRERGKLSAVAKGSRKPNSKLAGVTELFTASRLLLAEGRSLDIVSQAEIAASFPGLRMDLERLARATYFCELLDRLTADRDETRSEELYDLLIAALSLLQRADIYPDAIVHAYEMRLLRTQGFTPELEKCVQCGEPLERRTLGFSPSLGGTLCAADRYRVNDAVVVSPDAVDLLRTFLSGESEALLELQPAAKIAAEAARALRWYVRFCAERELKSAEFLDQLRASSR